MRWSLVAVLICACAPTVSHAADVARGRYLATIGDCLTCHTAPGGGHRRFAGGYPLHAYFGVVYSANITPDKETGIGNWSADDFYRALHDGIDDDGNHLYPAFPYPYFTKISRKDADDIYAYLRTVKPVHYTPPPNALIFPTNFRFGMIFWNWLFLDQSPITYDPARSPQWNRGRQIVDGLGHCGACHTPKTLLFNHIRSEALQGDALDGWYAPDLTGAEEGLGQWTKQDIVQFLKTGANRHTRVVGAMQDVVHHSTSQLSDADLNAIAVYLKSLPPGKAQPAKKPTAQAMEDGQTIYVQRCAVCHEAKSEDYPSLARNTLLLSRDPTTVLRIILHGAQAVPTEKAAIRFSMPAFPVLSNRELADVTTYIRNSWGNHAGAVSEGQAGQVRSLDRP